MCASPAHDMFDVQNIYGTPQVPRKKPCLRPRRMTLIDLRNVPLAEEDAPHRKASSGTIRSEGGLSHYSKGGISHIHDSTDSLQFPHQGSMRSKHTSGGSQDGSSRFPKLEECAHFHYDIVDFGSLQVTLCEEDRENYRHNEAEPGEHAVLVRVSCNNKSWNVRRTLPHFRSLDRQLHRCIFDRKFSQLPELHSANTDTKTAKELEYLLHTYLKRFSELADSMINCGSILNWLEMDNRGNRLLAVDDSGINTPAIAAAHAIKRYNAQAADEISLQVGDIVSVIDMPPAEDTIWWRGKRGFEVGFFPYECVEVITDKVPPSVASCIPSGSLSSSPGNTLTPAATPATARKPCEPSDSVDDLSMMRKHGKLMSFLRTFFSTRPPRNQLKQSGIVKERVFGCDLGEHLLNSGHDVPLVLKSCSEVIERHGIVDGIYRLSGITSNIQKLRVAFDEDQVPELMESTYLQDIHSISSLLKMYFRELPNPLLTYQLYDKFAEAVRDEDNKLLRIHDVVQQLPPPHYRTLEYLMRHLGRVASHSTETGMHSKNLAIVWAPNLLRSKELELGGGAAALQGVGIQAVVTECLICYCDIIFSDKMPSYGSPHLQKSQKKPRPKSLAISTPTRLLTLEEARERAFLGSLAQSQRFIDVGGGPASLPATYHTVIDLPGYRKKSNKDPNKGKKSPSAGWKSIFSKPRAGSMKKARKSSVQGDDRSIGSVQGRAITEEDVHNWKRRLRSAKSAESLLSMATSSRSSTSSHTSSGFNADSFRFRDDFLASYHKRSLSSDASSVIHHSYNPPHSTAAPPRDTPVDVHPESTSPPPSGKSSRADKRSENPRKQSFVRGDSTRKAMHRRTPSAPNTPRMERASADTAVNGQHKASSQPRLDSLPQSPTSDSSLLTTPTTDTSLGIDIDAAIKARLTQMAYASRSARGSSDSSPRSPEKLPPGGGKKESSVDTKKESEVDGRQTELGNGMLTLQESPGSHRRQSSPPPKTKFFVSRYHDYAEILSDDEKESRMSAPSSTTDMQELVDKLDSKLSSATKFFLPGERGTSQTSQNTSDTNNSQAADSTVSTHISGRTVERVPASNLAVDSPPPSTQVVRRRAEYIPSESALSAEQHGRPVEFPELVPRLPGQREAIVSPTGQGRSQQVGQHGNREAGLVRGGMTKCVSVPSDIAKSLENITASQTDLLSSVTISELSQSVNSFCPSLQDDSPLREDPRFRRSTSLDSLEAESTMCRTLRAINAQMDSAFHERKDQELHSEGRSASLDSPEGQLDVSWKAESEDANASADSTFHVKVGRALQLEEEGYSRHVDSDDTSSLSPLHISEDSLTPTLQETHFPASVGRDSSSNPDSTATRSRSDSENAPTPTTHPHQHSVPPSCPVTDIDVEMELGSRSPPVGQRSSERSSAGQRSQWSEEESSDLSVFSQTSLSAEESRNRDYGPSHKSNISVGDNMSGGCAHEKATLSPPVPRAREEHSVSETSVSGVTVMHLPRMGQLSPESLKSPQSGSGSGDVSPDVGSRAGGWKHHDTRLSPSIVRRPSSSSCSTSSSDAEEDSDDSYEIVHHAQPADAQYAMRLSSRQRAAESLPSPARLRSESLPESLSTRLTRHHTGSLDRGPREREQAADLGHLEDVTWRQSPLYSPGGRVGFSSDTEVTTSPRLQGQRLGSEGAYSPSSIRSASQSQDSGALPRWFHGRTESVEERGSGSHLPEQRPRLSSQPERGEVFTSPTHWHGDFRGQTLTSQSPVRVLPSPTKSRRVLSADSDLPIISGNLQSRTQTQPVSLPSYSRSQSQPQPRLPRQTSLHDSDGPSLGTTSSTQPLSELDRLQSSSGGGWVEESSHYGHTDPGSSAPLHLMLYHPDEFNVPLATVGAGGAQNPQPQVHVKHDTVTEEKAVIKKTSAQKSPETTRPVDRLSDTGKLSARSREAPEDRTQKDWQSLLSEAESFGGGADNNSSSGGGGMVLGKLEQDAMEVDNLCNKLVDELHSSRPLQSPPTSPKRPYTSDSWNRKAGEWSDSASDGQRQFNSSSPGETRHKFDSVSYSEKQCQFSVDTSAESHHRVGSTEKRNRSGVDLRQFSAEQEVSASRGTVQVEAVVERRMEDPGTGRAESVVEQRMLRVESFGDVEDEELQNAVNTGKEMLLAHSAPSSSSSSSVITTVSTSSCSASSSPTCSAVTSPHQSQSRATHERRPSASKIPRFHKRTDSREEKQLQGDSPSPQVEVSQSSPVSIPSSPLPERRSPAGASRSKEAEQSRIPRHSQQGSKIPLSHKVPSPTGSGRESGQKLPRPVTSPPSPRPPLAHNKSQQNTQLAHKSQQSKAAQNQQQPVPRTRTSVHRSDVPPPADEVLEVTRPSVKKRGSIGQGRADKERTTSGREAGGRGEKNVIVKELKMEKGDAKLVIEKQPSLKKKIQTVHARKVPHPPRQIAEALDTECRDSPSADLSSTGPSDMEHSGLSSQEDEVFSDESLRASIGRRDRSFSSGTRVRPEHGPPSPSLGRSNVGDSYNQMTASRSSLDDSALQLAAERHDTFIPNWERAECGEYSTGSLRSRRSLKMQNLMEMFEKASTSNSSEDSSDCTRHKDRSDSNSGSTTISAGSQDREPDTDDDIFRPPSSPRLPASILARRSRSRERATRTASQPSPHRGPSHSPSSRRSGTAARGDERNLRQRRPSPARGGWSPSSQNPEDRQQPAKRTETSVGLGRPPRYRSSSRGRVHSDSSTSESDTHHQESSYNAARQRALARSRTEPSEDFPSKSDSFDSAGGREKETETEQGVQRRGSFKELRQLFEKGSESQDSGNEPSPPVPVRRTVRTRSVSPAADSNSQTAMANAMRRSLEIPSSSSLLKQQEAKVSAQPLRLGPKPFYGSKK